MSKHKHSRTQWTDYLRVYLCTVILNGWIKALGIGAEPKTMILLIFLRILIFPWEVICARF